MHGLICSESVNTGDGLLPLWFVRATCLGRLPGTSLSLSLSMTSCYSNLDRPHCKECDAGSCPTHWRDDEDWSFIIKGQSDSSEASEQEHGASSEESDQAQDPSKSAAHLCSTSTNPCIELLDITFSIPEILNPYATCIWAEIQIRHVRHMMIVINLWLCNVAIF